MSTGGMVEDAEVMLCKDKEQPKREMEQLKVENRELLSSIDRLKQEVRQLKELLMDKEQLVCTAVKHVQGSKLQSVSHEEELCKRVTQAEENHRKELLEKEESFKRKLQDKEDMWRREFSEREDKLRKELAKEKEKFHNEMLQHEELMKLKLLDEDETFQKLLTEVCHHWETSAQNWADKQRELGEMIQKNTNTWRRMEIEYKKEIQHLTEKILQLQGHFQPKGL